MTERVKDILKEHKADIKRRFGVKRIGLFGSCARGEEREDSDVDVIVEFEDPNFDDFMDLAAYLEDLFDRPVDILTRNGLKNIRIPEVSQLPSPKGKGLYTARPDCIDNLIISVLHSILQSRNGEACSFTFASTYLI